MAFPIKDDAEMRQSMFSTLREMANMTVNLAYGDEGYIQYPWEVVDGVQEDRRAALKAHEYDKAKKLETAVEALRLWRNALVELNNTVNIPDEDENDWFLD